MNGCGVRAETSPDSSSQGRTHGSAAEVFLVFLRLGCTSFGGPIAHLGYFQKEIVERRKWCDERTMAEIIALAQSLPGPASSQVGFALGILRAGWRGGLAAWVGFTLPSAVLMFAFAHGHSFPAGDGGEHFLHGLQLVAVAVVAQAVLTMQRSLAPDHVRMTFAMMAAGIVLFGPSAFSMLIAIAVGALGGLLLLPSEKVVEGQPARLHLPKVAGLAAAAAFLAFLVIPPLLGLIAHNRAIDVFSAFYRTGALVFGGGHVVLPLLENSVVTRGWVSQPTFLAGYGAAQALPGPLFAIGAYLGAAIRPSSSPLSYGLLGLVGIFMPGLLAMTAVLPFWNSLRESAIIRTALKGINASVVGVLLAALYRPLWTSTIHTVSDFGFALLAFMLLTLWKIPPWIVVVGITAGYVLTYGRPGA